jgi:hypothetical protein
MEILSRIAAQTSLDVRTAGFLHFFRTDTNELIVSAEQFATFRSVLEQHKRHLGASFAGDTVCMEWRWDPKPADASTVATTQRAQEPRSAQAVIPIFEQQQPVAMHGTPQRESAPAVLLSPSERHLAPLPKALRGQLRAMDHARGFITLIPFDAVFPPSFWVLLQLVSHFCGIPAVFIELDVSSSDQTYNEWLAVQSDFDVRAISHLMLQGAEPTLHVIDTRLGAAP